MNATASRVIIGVIWLASIGVAFFIGRHSGSDHPQSGISKPQVTTLGGSTAHADGKSATSGTAVASDSEKASSGESNEETSSARRAYDAVANAKRELGSGGAFMFSPSAMFRAFGPLMELPPEEVKAAIAEVETSVDDLQQKQIFLSLLLGRWAEENPREALAYAEKLIEDSGPGANQATFSVIGSWAQQDPDGAWEWYLKKRDSDDPIMGGMGNDMHLHVIFRGMASRDVNKALQRLGQIDDDQSMRQAAFGLTSAAAGDPTTRDRVLAQSANMEPELQDMIRQGVLSQWAPTDIEGAMNWMRKLPAEERDKLATATGYSLIFANPKKGAEFLMEDATPENLSQRYQTIMNSWANRDVNAAGEWLNAQPPSPAQDSARSNFASVVSRRDPDSGMEWAKTITNEDVRFSAIRNVYLQWQKKDDAAAGAALLNTGLPDEKIEEILKIAETNKKKPGPQATMVR
ncbi:MAG: hypothetical protein KDN19_15005 [Verrucomicrobiae bacterium]|nr:hypothetical protein [Verrucomicrobiae bacterium]